MRGIKRKKTLKVQGQIRLRFRSETKASSLNHARWNDQWLISLYKINTTVLSKGKAID